VFSRQYRKVQPFLILADFLLIWLAFEAAYATRSQLQMERLFYLSDTTKALLSMSSSLAWVLTGLWLGIYDSVLRGSWGEMWANALRQSLWGIGWVVALQYVHRFEEYALSRPFIALLFFYSFALLIIFRLTVRAGARRIWGGNMSRRHVYVAGTGEAGLRVARLIEQNESFGLSLDGFFDDRPGSVQLGRRYEVQELAKLPEVLRLRIVDEIVFAVDSGRLADLEETLLLCEEEGVRTRIHMELFPHLHSRVHLERLENEQMLTFASAPHDEVRLMIKRGLDITIALGALAILWPLLLVIALLIRVNSPGPAIFRQERSGLNGRRFVLFKFRTMVKDAEAQKAALEHLNVKQTAFKIPNDPRVTGVGKWLRRFSLDELPQLWNIVRGEMAIVGPRPPLPEEVDHYERWQRRRLRMRPGLTCLWALAGRDSLGFEDWMRLDLKYIDEWSLRLDWAIILGTLPRVLSGRGAS